MRRLARRRRYKWGLVAQSRRLSLDTSGCQRLHHRCAGFIGHVAAHEDRGSRERGGANGLPGGRSANALHLSPNQGRIHIRVDLEAEAAVAFFLLEDAVAAHETLAAVGERGLELDQPGRKRLCLTATFLEQVRKGALDCLAKRIGQSALLGHNRVAVHDGRLRVDHVLTGLRRGRQREEKNRDGLPRNETAKRRPTQDRPGLGLRSHELRDERKT
jgi:hypothetical protein